MKNILFLDDDHFRLDFFRSQVPSGTFVETAQQAIEALTKETFDVLFLDHDLGGNIFVDSGREDTGMEVVRWIVENKPSIKCGIVVHSLNYEGAKAMCRALRNAKYDAEYFPFTSLRDHFEEALATCQKRVGKET